MRGGIRRFARTAALAVAATFGMPSTASREGLDRTLTLEMLEGWRAAARRRERRAYKVQHGGSAPFAPRGGGKKERAKWKRRMASGWHQPRGTGDQYVYRSFPAAMAVIS